MVDNKRTHQTHTKNARGPATVVYMLYATEIQTAQTRTRTCTNWQTTTLGWDVKNFSDIGMESNTQTRRRALQGPPNPANFADHELKALRLDAPPLVCYWRQLVLPRTLSPCLAVSLPSSASPYPNFLGEFFTCHTLTNANTTLTMPMQTRPVVVVSISSDEQWVDCQACLFGDW